MRAPASLLCLLVFAVLVSSASAPTAQAAKGLEVAVQDDHVLLKRYWGDPARTWTRARQVHASWVRVMVEWGDTLGPAAKRKKRVARPKYAWASYDKLIREARARGIKTQLALTGPAPAWATGNKKLAVTSSYRPSAKEYARFVRAAVKHFKARGVRRYSLWNEPNHVGYLAPLREQPKLYRALWVAGYKALRKVDRKAQVLFAETAPWAKAGQSVGPLKFVRAVLCVDKRYRTRSKKCPRLVADGYAQHPYDAFYAPTRRRPGADNVTISTLDRLTRALDKLGRLGALRRRTGGRMPVYLTEFGYFTGNVNPSTRSYPESVRPRYLTQSFDIALRNPRVKQLLWYQLVEPPPAANRTWVSFILRLDDTPMPTFAAFARWSAKNASKLAR